MFQAVAKGGQVWPAGNHGICGDPYADATPRKHEAGGKYWTGEIAGTYEQGGLINITTVVTTYHKGRFGYRICKIDGNSVASETAQLTEECFNNNVLVQADVPGAQAPGDRWQHLGATHAEGYQGTFEAVYQLPKNLVCDGVHSRCVLQWYYLTGNSCNPPNEPEQYAADYLPTCGAAQSTYPEEFWNCADIAINSASGSSPAPTQKPSPSPQPKPSPSSPSPSPPKGNAVTGCEVGVVSSSTWKNPSTKMYMSSINVYVTNTGNSFISSPWTLTMTNSAYKTVTKTWNWDASIPSRGGTIVGTTSSDWETLLPNKGSSVSMGFIVSGTSKFLTPKTAILNGVQCKMVNPKPKAPITP